MFARPTVPANGWWLTIWPHFADKCYCAFFTRLALYAIFIRFVVEYRSCTFILFLFVCTGAGIPCQAGRCIGGLGANRTVIVAGPPVKKTSRARYRVERTGNGADYVSARTDPAEWTGNVADPVRARTEQLVWTGKGADPVRARADRAEWTGKGADSVMARGGRAGTVRERPAGTVGDRSGRNGTGSNDGWRVCLSGDVVFVFVLLYLCGKCYHES